MKDRLGQVRIDRSTVLLEPEHASPRTGARFSENGSTILGEPEHSFRRTGARFSENQSTPKLENWRTREHILNFHIFIFHVLHALHVLPSRMVGWNNLCSPGAIVLFFILMLFYDFYDIWLEALKINYGLMICHQEHL